MQKSMFLGSYRRQQKHSPTSVEQVLASLQSSRVVVISRESCMKRSGSFRSSLRSVNSLGCDLVVMDLSVANFELS